MMTPDQLRTVLDEYFIPLYQILGGIAAVAVISFTIWLVLKPFLRRIR